MPPPPTDRWHRRCRRSSPTSGRRARRRAARRQRISRVQVTFRDPLGNAERRPHRMPHVPGRPTVAEVSLGASARTAARRGALVGPASACWRSSRPTATDTAPWAGGARFLDGGAAGLGVSMVAEGLELRRAGIEAPIVVLGGVFPGEEGAAVTHDLAAAVWTLEARDALAAAAARRAGRTAARAPEGRHRDDAARLRAGRRARRSGEALRVGGWHLATRRRVLAFRLGRRGGARRRRRRSAIASAGAVAALRRGGHPPAARASREQRRGAVRRRRALHAWSAPGSCSTATRPRRISEPRAAPAGDAAVAPRWRRRVASRQARRSATAARGSPRVDSTIATLPLGYADGYHRAASNRGAMLVRGRRAPIAGRVCMDHVMLDVTDVPTWRPARS